MGCGASTSSEDVYYAASDDVSSEDARFVAVLYDEIDLYSEKRREDAGSEASDGQITSEPSAFFRSLSWKHKMYVARNTHNITDDVNQFPWTEDDRQIVLFSFWGQGEGAGTMPFRLRRWLDGVAVAHRQLLLERGGLHDDVRSAHTNTTAHTNNNNNFSFNISLNSARYRGTHSDSATDTEHRPTSAVSWASTSDRRTAALQHAFFYAGSDSEEDSMALTHDVDAASTTTGGISPVTGEMSFGDAAATVLPLSLPSGGHEDAQPPIMNGGTPKLLATPLRKTSVTQLPPRPLMALTAMRLSKHTAARLHRKVQRRQREAAAMMES